MIQAIQTKLIELFEAHKEDSAANAPKVIEAYDGQLKNPKRLVRTMPALYVDVTSDFNLTAQDIMGEILSGDFAPEIILFDKNSLNEEKTYGEMATLIDWVIAALKGKTIVVDGQPILVGKNIRGRYLGDLVPAAVLTLNLETSEE